MFARKLSICAPWAQRSPLEGVHAWRVAHVVPHEQAAIRFRHIQKRLRLDEAQRKRFFHKYALARRQCAYRKRHVAVVARADKDRIDRVVRKQLLRRGKRLCAPSPGKSRKARLHSRRKPLKIRFRRAGAPQSAKGRSRLYQSLLFAISIPP